MIRHERRERLTAVSWTLELTEVKQALVDYVRRVGFGTPSWADDPDRWTVELLDGNAAKVTWMRATEEAT